MAFQKWGSVLQHKWWVVLWQQEYIFIPSHICCHRRLAIQQVDKLFDYFNSICKYHFKKILGGISSDSCHMDFIGEITKYIKSLEICTPPHVHIHCITGWLINLASLRALWQDLKCYDVKHLLTRRLNQDCLENLFGKLRLRGGTVTIQLHLPSVKL